MKPHRLALIVSLPTMILIWLFAASVLGYALHEWKDTWRHSVVHALAIVTLIALCALIPVQIIQSVRNGMKQNHGTGKHG